MMNKNNIVDGLIDGDQKDILVKLTVRERMFIVKTLLHMPIHLSNEKKSTLSIQIIGKLYK